MILEMAIAVCKAAMLLFVFVTILASAFSDTPANCTYEDISGKWVFSIGGGGLDSSVSCTNFSGPYSSEMQVTLQYPDIAVDQFGNVGFWTIIYNQGFEVDVAGRKFFAFSMYKEEGKKVTSMCSLVLPGWTHDDLSHDWACYTGKKEGAPVVKTSQSTQFLEQPSLASVLKFQPLKSTSFNNLDFIDRINKAQNSWTAAHYPHLEGLSREHLLAMRGGPASKVAHRPSPAPPTKEVLEAAAKLPDSFDWRNVDGINYVSPIRNQASCGSCYAFASMAMNEARVRIMTNNTKQPVFSPQDIVDCSEYSQGCAGGFPYLIAGKYAEDFGLVLEEDNPYNAKDHDSCQTLTSANRYYSTKYEYVGGYYGACNEALMRLALYENGPLAVGFEVLSDFQNYKGGIYHHTGLTAGFEPFELTNHAVLIVGYGVDESTGQPFWIVKNSWGTKWGEDGFFRIRRGTDEVAIESMAVQSTPIISLL